MIRRPFPSSVGAALLGAAIMIAGPVSAEPGTDVISLSPEQREAAIEAGATTAADNRGFINGVDGRIHGEIGMEIGSRGSRALYGTAIMPLGQDGSAAISVLTERTRFGRRR